ncbi:TPA: gallidermin family lantibiotic [Klebsiella pneumoniae]|nr:gallidermin family lantibiotic [Klebsiella pneumoniae]MBD7742756.1 gallidermin family lantibiotic [Klebsiella pneumoniae]HCI5431558.1 gallidermin family lantibiotic [Klebsiella pneumoniae]
MSASIEIIWLTLNQPGFSDSRQSQIDRRIKSKSICTPSPAKDIHVITPCRG